MPKLIGIQKGKGGVTINRTLRCMNQFCTGIIETAQGPAPVRFAQIQYAGIPAPECPYCGIQMAVESLHNTKAGHTRRADEHKVMDKIQEQVFSHAEGTSHKLAENTRQGDVAKVVLDPSAAAYLKQTEEMAKKANMHTGFANSNFSSHRKMVAGVAADSTFARDTVRQGAAMPVSALALATGNPGFSGAGGNGSQGIVTGGHQFWRTPSSSRKIR